MNTTAEILAILHSMPQGCVMRNRDGINPCVVLRFTGFMSAVTFAEGETWEEVLARLQADPRVAVSAENERKRREQEKRDAAARPTRRTHRRGYQ